MPPTDSSPAAIRTGRRWRAPLAAAAVLLLVPALSWLALQSRRVQDTLLARVNAELAARCPGALVTGTVHLDRLFRLVAGPIVLPSRTAGAPPLVRVERMTVRPSMVGLVGGRLEAASVALDGVRIEAGPRGEALAELTGACAMRARATSSRSAMTPKRDFTLTFSRLSLAFGWPTDPETPPPELGPLAGSGQFRRAGIVAHARPHRVRPQGGQFAAHLLVLAAQLL